MKSTEFRLFLKLFAWIAPLNAVVTIVALSLQLWWISSVLQWVAMVLNFPTICLVVVAKELWEKSDVNWSVAIPLLTIVGSLFWAGASAFILAAVEKRRHRGTEV